MIKKWNFRALELHGRSMWDHLKIEHAFRFVREHDLNALVLHESDLTNQIVFPRTLFDPFSQWQDAPVRRGFNAIHNDRMYLRQILKLAEQYKTQVWLELKELTFPDEVLERYPHLLKNGIVCPTESVWMEFIEHKFDELAKDFPQLTGVITSPGSPEGRSSLVQRKCTCPSCNRTDLTQWYSDIINSIYGPLTRAGMKLAVRDFSYKKPDQEAIIAAVDQSPRDIIFCIKVTPHDFYPSFPHNPALGRLDRTQWIEYDAFGQYFGWGIFPCYMHKDLAARMTYSAAQGASGILLRTEWERINDLWCLETFNRANLIAGAALAVNRPQQDEDIVRQTLEGLNWVASESEAGFVTDMLKQSWTIQKQGIYLDDFVFHDNSQFPLSPDKARWTMAEHHSLLEWDPEHSDLPQSLPEIEPLIDEKNEAITLIRDLRDRLRRYSAENSSDLSSWLAQRLTLYCHYIEGFRLITELYLWKELSDREGASFARTNSKKVVEILKSMRILQKQLKKNLSAGQRHQIHMLLDTDRLETWQKEGESWVQSS